MSEQPRLTTDRVRELLASLGLPPTAGAADLDAVRTHLAGQLVDASSDVRDRAETLLSQLDEVEPLLVEGDAAAAAGLGDAVGVTFLPSAELAAERAAAAGAPAARTADPVAPATEPGEAPTREAAVRRPRSTAEPAPDGFEDDAPLRRRTAAASPARGRSSLTRGLRFAALGALTVGIVMGIYISGLGQPAASSSALPEGHPAMGASVAPSVVPTLDEAQAAALKAKAAADPRDEATAKALAELYAASGEWSEAARWQGTFADLAPADTDRRLILGVYAFNDGDLDGAEQAWLEVARVDPTKAEAYYDLGFVYLAQTPPDQAKAWQAWQKVIDIDPTSELAQTVQNHLSALATASPAPSATPSKS